MSYPTNIGPAPWQQYTPYQGNSYQVPPYAQPQNNPPPFIPRAYPQRTAGAGGATNGYYSYGQGQATPNYGHHVPIQDSLNPPDLDSRPKKFEPRHRKNSSAPKSAMKRSATATAAIPVPDAGKEPFPSFAHAGGHTPQEGANGNLHRHHSTPEGTTNTLHRQRTHSNPNKPVDLGQPYAQGSSGDTPAYYMFVSFSDYDILRLENVPDPALKEISSVLPRMWLDGIEYSDMPSDYTWRAKLRNQPFRVRKNAIVNCAKLIVDLFSLFARRGYLCLQTLDLSSAAPRLVFQIAPVIENPIFFIGFFSKKQTQFTLVRPPQAVDKFLGRRLKERLEKGAIASDQEQNETLRIIELNRNSSRPVEPCLFMMHVLSALNEIFYNLDATIPLRDDRLHHPNHKKEILVFRYDHETAANMAGIHQQAQMQDAAAFVAPPPKEKHHRRSR